MSKRAAVLTLCLATLLLVLPAGSAAAGQVRSFPGIDCKEAPTPDMPGQGLAAFFDHKPNPLPAQGDPFAPGSKTTIYEQYGFAGLQWHTYDLGCGPDAARHPDAVIGTALSNWTMNGPIAFTSLTASLTRVAFHPTFLDVFDPTIERVSQSLHRSLFATWVPAVIALLGILILIRAHRAALATTAAAIGWALMVVLVATAIFRWPIAAGHFADATVTRTLSAVSDSLDGRDTAARPAVSVASNVQESIFYNSWLAGTLGSATSPTAKKYGPDLFKAQALTWHEADVVQHDPEHGKALIEAKQQRWDQLASQIKESDPAAYEYLTGKRSDVRVGYAALSSLAAYLALPFLLVSALLLLGSFLIVRLAVMMFPAFATIGVFPAGRGVVTGIARTVGAALINAVIFGVGAAVTIRVLTLIFDPTSKLPGWLVLVLMPLFSFIMWVALKPFRRLTTMVGPQTDPFGDAAGALGDSARHGRRWARKAAATAVGVYTGNFAAAATVSAHDHETDEKVVPERAEAKNTRVEPAALSAAQPRALPTADAPVRGSSSSTPSEPGPSQPPPGWTPRTEPRELPEGFVPRPSSEGVPMPPTEPDWHDGDEVYAIYHPTDDGMGDDAA